MTPERWATIERLYHESQARHGEERRAFLDEACGSDDALRREVESLLAHDGQADFLSTPFVPTGGGALVIGQRLGPYAIRSWLGEGGMGEVYRASDSKLGRDVAIKTLPRIFASDPERLARFGREARMLATLNHPHIGAIYGLEDVDGIPALVLELVEGPTLAERLAQGPLPVPEVLSVACQLADALEAAHAKGVIHRDLKPANIKIAPDGAVKVLDFGLAKLEERTRRVDDDTTMRLARTEAGIVLGTVAYMSPEQARAEEVDARTDLFSLGAVLYEMATGRRPFLKPLDWAPPATDLLPPALRLMVLKLLEVDRERRYQHASELRADLQRLIRDTDAAPVATRSHPDVIAAIGTRWKLVAPGAAAVLAFLVGAYIYVHRTLKLTDKDTIVLADFKNTTGEAVFDETLRQGLAVQLGQSPFLSLISDQHIHRTLALMKQPADAKLSSEIAMELCKRSNSAAVLEGSIASLGTQYVVALRAKNCQTGDILDDEQVTAAKKEDVLNALSQIAGNFRTRVGESLATVKAHQVPLVEATTASLDALEAYSAAQAINVSKGGAAAITLFKRAAELDPNFALAEAHLGAAYSGMGESILANKSLRKAYDLRDHTSEPEKFFITFNYHRNVTGNLEKAHEAAELWTQTFPRDVRAHGFMSASVTQGLGLYEQSIEQGQLAVAIDPDFIFGYTNPAWSYLFLNRPEDAQHVIDTASERKLEPDEFFVLRYYDAFLRGDQAGMDRQATLAKGRHGTDDWITHAQALVSAHSGHLRQARELTRRAVDLAERARDHEKAATYESAAAAYEALFGNTAEAKRRAAAALALSKGRDVEYAAAIALALAGDFPRSEMLANDLDRRFPEDTWVRFHYLPTLRALAALHAGKPATAGEQLQTASRYELAMNGFSLFAFCGAMFPAYVRGEALLAGRNGAAAVAEFQKLVDHPGIVLADPSGALAVLQIGRAWALAGDHNKANAAYRDFLTRWKDADADIPILQQAKAEYAKLQ
jgi:eukaryotic-like serine/threonine-protein kinase